LSWSRSLFAACSGVSIDELIHSVT
jgi:hypothetical protein